MTAQSAFPPLPEYGAHARTVYWEPIQGSGERIAILVAARSELEWRVQETVGPATWQCFLGNQAGTATRLIGLVAESLRRHLDAGKRLDAWAPPLSGIHPGDTRYLLGRDLNQVLRIALRDTSAFAVLPQALDFDDDLAPEENGPAEDRWPNQVRKLVVANRPRLGGYFGRKVEVCADARATALDYAGERYCANFAKLLPDIRLGHWIGKAKVKLLDLEQVRGHTTAGDLLVGLGTVPEFELILYRPDPDDPGYTDKAMLNLDKAVVQLEDFADSHEMRLILAQRADQAANRLLEREAA